MKLTMLGTGNALVTEDRNLARRKAMYVEEGAPHFSGNLFVPDDLETVEL